MEFKDIMAEIDQVSQLSDISLQENQVDENNKTTAEQLSANDVQENSQEQHQISEKQPLNQKDEQLIGESQLKQSNISIKSDQQKQNSLSNSATYMAIIQAQDDQITQMKQQLQQATEYAKEEAKKELRQQYNIQLKQKLVEQFKQELLQDIPTEIKKIVLQQTSDEEIETLAFDVLQKYKNEYNKQMEQQLQVKYQQIEKIRAQAEDKSKLKQQEIEFKKKIDALNRQIEQNNSKNMIKIQKIQQKCEKLQEEAQEKEKQAQQLREQTAQYLEQIKELTQQQINVSQLEKQVQLLQNQVHEYKQLNEKLTTEFNNQAELLQKYQQQIEQFNHSIHNTVKEKQVTFKDDVKQTLKNSGVIKQSTVKNAQNNDFNQTQNDNQQFKLILDTTSIANNQLKQQQAIQRMQSTNNKSSASFLEQMKSKYLYQNQTSSINNNLQEKEDIQSVASLQTETYNFKSNLLNNLQNSQQQIQDSLIGQDTAEQLQQLQQEAFNEDEVIQQLNDQNTQQQLYYQTIQSIVFVNKNQKLYDLVTRAFQFLLKIFEDNEIDFFYRYDFVTQNIQQNNPKESLYIIKSELQKQNQYKQEYGNIIYLIKMREDIKQQNNEDLDAVQQIVEYIRNNGDVTYRGIPYSKILRLEGIEI